MPKISHLKHLVVFTVFWILQFYIAKVIDTIAFTHI